MEPLERSGNLANSDFCAYASFAMPKRCFRIACPKYSDLSGRRKSGKSHIVIVKRHVANSQ